MKNNVRDVLRLAEEGNVRFAELLFTGVFGGLRSLTVPAGALADIFQEGFGLDVSDIPGFMGVTDTDLLLRPSPESLMLADNGQRMLLFCDITRPDNTPFEGDGRYYLSLAAERAKKMGLDIRIGTAGEFYLFRRGEDGKPVRTPADSAGRCAAFPDDRCGELRRVICGILAQYEISVGMMSHSSGPGQNSISIAPLPPVAAADAYTVFMRTAKAEAQDRGLFASFMPKPLSDEKGSGLEIALRCREGGSDVFRQTDGRISGSAGKIIGGLLRSLPAMTLFMNSITNSYARLDVSGLAGKAAWSNTNADTALRLRSVRGNTSELVLRTPDSSGNIYYMLGLVINACIEGVNQGAAAPRPVTADGKRSSGADRLPGTLTEALKAAENDGFIRSVTDTRMLSCVLEEKRRMCRAFEEARDKESYENTVFFPIL